MNVRQAVVSDMEPATTILIEALVKRYRASDAPAVDGIDLEVRQGEIFGLLGPNGAGKTTTIGVCTTRVIADAGRVRVVGVDVAEDPARVKRFIGVVTQYSTLDRSLTARENLIYHARYFGAGRQEARGHAERLLERFQLTGAGHRLPDELSGGMAQRLQIARAIGHGPRVLFLDEPTAGLDPQSRLGLWDLVRELRAEGTTILLTTHNMAEADELCDRVAIIDHGRILVCDAPERLKQMAGTTTEIHLDTPGAPSGARRRAQCHTGYQLGGGRPRRDPDSRLWPGRHAATGRRGGSGSSAAECLSEGADARDGLHRDDGEGAP